MPPLVRKATCYPGEKRLHQGFVSVFVFVWGGFGRGARRSFPEEENKATCYHSTIRARSWSAGTSQQVLAAFFWLNVSLSRISHPENFPISATWAYAGRHNSKARPRSQWIHSLLRVCRDSPWQEKGPLFPKEGRVIRLDGTAQIHLEGIMIPDSLIID